jgi:hypothetical protein
MLFIYILWSLRRAFTSPRCKNNVEHPAGFLQIEKMQLYRGFGCIYAHKNENLQKNRVSATSCVFEYYISNIKNQKRKKLRENWKSLHNLVLLVGFLIFHVLVCQLVGQKNQKKGTSFFRVQDRDYMYLSIDLSLSRQSIIVSTRVTRTPHFFSEGIDK